MAGGKLKPGWRQGIERLIERDQLLGFAETDTGFSFKSVDSLRERTNRLLKALELGFERINALRKARGLPPV